MTRRTPTQVLIETRLGQPLDLLVHRMLTDGAGWRRIADEVRHRTGIPISHETLRGWFRVTTG